MMRPVFACAAALAALLTTTATAHAQEVPEVAFNIGVFSDYVFRGFSQTAEDPAIQGGVDATYGSAYAGAWASNVDFGDDTDGEVDLYAGVRPEGFGFTFDVGAIAYLYLNAPGGADYDYLELKAAASRAVGPVTLGAGVYYSPDFFAADEAATYVEATASLALADKWTLSGAIGHQSLDVNDDYTTWNAGVAYAVTDHVIIDARYFDTDVDGPLSEDRFVGALKVLF